MRLHIHEHKNQYAQSCRQNRGIASHTFPAATSLPQVCIVSFSLCDNWDWLHTSFTSTRPPQVSLSSCDPSLVSTSDCPFPGHVAETQRYFLLPCGRLLDLFSASQILCVALLIFAAACKHDRQAERFLWPHLPDDLGAAGDHVLHGIACISISSITVRTEWKWAVAGHTWCPTLMEHFPLESLECHRQTETPVCVELQTGRGL